MTGRVAIRQMASGVPGLDAVLGGGIPEYSFNYIAGPPGAGKSTLAHQMMFAMASSESPALFITLLGEPPLKVLRYQQQFAFFDSSAVNRSVRFVNLGDDSQTGDLDRVLKRVENEVEATAPAFVFVDSFRSVVLSSETQGNSDGHIQQFVAQLGMLMTSWQATTFLVGENLNESDANPVYSVADGLLWLRQSMERNSMVRKLQVLKMRGQASLAGLHPFRINASGLEVFPPPDVEHVDEHAEQHGFDTYAPDVHAPDVHALDVHAPDVHAPDVHAPDVHAPDVHARSPRALMGVPKLDAMLGGGLPRGYSLLVAGPSGSGKSILAAAFLVEGARTGEHGVIASFEQRPGRIRTPRLAELLARGKATVIDSSAPDLSIDEVVQRLLREIRRTNATRVVIDSLSGFELCLAPTFRAEFRESLARLVTALAASGVTTLMTSELEDRYTDLRFSPYGTAFLTDAIIVQRYIEIGSRLRRLLAVVKVRASPHSDELRAYTIDDDGIQIGEMLSDEEGLLGGRPTRNAAALAATPVFEVARV